MCYIIYLLRVVFSGRPRHLPTALCEGQAKHLAEAPPSAGLSRRGGADGNTAPGKPGGRQLPPIPPIGFSTPPIEFSTPPIEISKPGIENPIGGVVGGAAAREQTAAGVPISAVRGNFAEPRK